MKTEDLAPAIAALKALVLGEDAREITPASKLKTSCQKAIQILEGMIKPQEADYTLEIDGASLGNPGPAGIGVVLYDPNGKIMERISTAITKTTNNVAEYMALLAGLNLALEYKLSNLIIRTDSELVAKQLCGEYKIKKKELIELSIKVNSCLKKLNRYTINRIPREQNCLADRLASTAAKRQISQG